MKINSPSRRTFIASGFASAFTAFCLRPVPLLAQGSLTPPGAPAPTMKTLDQLDARLEPRTAINAANTPGDATSVFKITQPGSYYLTGNLAGVSGKHGIVIVTSGVTLDLNGFDLLGGSGTLSGVSISTAGLTNIAVIHGSIRNWGGLGIAANVTNMRVTAILVSGNQAGGIQAGTNSAITNCTATNNSGNAGMSAGTNSTFTNCSVYLNLGTSGMSLSSFTIISNCSVYDNQGPGITTKGDCTLIGCTASQNTGDGIASGNSVISNCASIGNGGNVIVRNSVRGGTNAYGGIAGGNDVGPIGSAATATSPWANISY